MLSKLKEKIKDRYYYSWLSIIAQWITNVFYAYPFYRILHKTSISFQGSKPKPNQHYLIVSNHLSMKDPPLIGNCIELPVAFIAKTELFRNPFLKAYMYLTSTIEVDRDNPDSSTFKQAKKALQSRALGLAWSVVIFIEGTRSKQAGQLGKPNKGAIFIARLAKVPIIPCGVRYNPDKSISVSFGEPYEIDYKGDLEDQAWTCLEKISKLSGLAMPSRI